MPRKLLDDVRAGQFLAWAVTRGKCSYGDRHESVRQVAGQWYGESSNSLDCDYAPQDQCTVCAGRGRVELDANDPARFDGSNTKDRQCEPCRGTGYVPGPHWPWRHPHPGPVRRG
jgi:hypothetical protein